MRGNNLLSDASYGVGEASDRENNEIINNICLSIKHIREQNEVLQQSIAKLEIRNYYLRCFLNNEIFDPYIVPNLQNNSRSQNQENIRSNLLFGVLDNTQYDIRNPESLFFKISFQKQISILTDFLNDETLKSNALVDRNAELVFENANLEESQHNIMSENRYIQNMPVNSFMQFQQVFQPGEFYDHIVVNNSFNPHNIPVYLTQNNILSQQLPDNVFYVQQQSNYTYNNTQAAYNQVSVQRDNNNSNFQPQPQTQTALSLMQYSNSAQRAELDRRQTGSYMANETHQGHHNIYYTNNFSGQPRNDEYHSVFYGP